MHHFEDVECWLRISIKTNWKIEGIPEALTLYRVNLQGASTNISRQIEDQEKVIEKTRLYAPELVAKCADRARAYELRFLARRSVSLRDGKAAAKLAHRALATHWRILLEEPRRTLLTLGAAYSLWILPESFYRQLESIALNITGAAQKRRILQEQPK